MKKKALLIFVLFFIIIAVCIIFFSKSFLPSKKTSSSITPSSNSPDGSSKTDTKRSSCIIFPQEFCKTAAIVEGKNQLGGEYRLLAFKLSAGTPIYAAADGDLIKGNASAGILLTVKDLNNTSPDAVSYGVQGDIKPAEDVVTRKVKKGDIIGYTQDTGVKLPFSGVSGDYNVAVFATQSSNKQVIYKVNVLQNLFSN